MIIIASKIARFEIGCDNTQFGCCWQITTFQAFIINWWVKNIPKVALPKKIEHMKKNSTGSQEKAKASCYPE